MADHVLTGQDIVTGLRRAAERLEARADALTSLDQAMGDGDLGITAKKIAGALKAYLEDAPGEDLGKYLMASGMKVNSAAPSTMGTLIATALMRAGKEAKGLSEIGAATLADMLDAADAGIQERGKAAPGDKTIIDALHPGAAAFRQAIEAGAGLAEAGQIFLDNARAGRDAVTPLQSKIGRAGWVGERTQGLVDPGCAFLVTAVEGALGVEADA